MSMTVLGLSADHILLSTSGAPTAMSPHARHPTSLTSTRRSSSTSRPTTTVEDGQRWSTWLSVEPLCRGPEPRPDWVVTSQAAIDTELGILKTGKEADVFLLERAVPGSRPTGRRRRVRGHGGQALPRRGAPRLPPVRGLHRGPQGPEHPRQPGDGQEDRPRTGGRRRPVGLGRVGRAGALPRARPAGPLPRADRRHRAPHGVDHRTTARPRPGSPRPGRSRDAAGVVLRPAAGLPGRAGPARAGARRPVAVQHPRRRRAAGRHRPAADGRPGRQPGGHGLPAARLHERLHAGSAPAASRSTSTSCSAS